MQKIIATLTLAVSMALAVSVAAAFGAAPEAKAHARGWDSINGSGYVVVIDQTRYSSALYDSMAWWNRFHFDYNRRGPAFVYGKDTTMNPTLKVVDFWNCNTNAAGVYSKRYGQVDLVKLNVCHMNKHGGFYRRVVVGHELGHGLGFDHTPDTETYRQNSIMYPGTNQPKQYPRRHDRVDYYNRFIR